MFPFTTARFDENETVRAFNVLGIQCPALAVLDCEIVDGPIHKLKGRKDFRQLSLCFPKQRQDVLELWQGEHHVIRCLRSRSDEDGDTGHNTEGTLSTDE